MADSVERRPELTIHELPFTQRKDRIEVLLRKFEHVFAVDEPDSTEALTAATLLLAQAITEQGERR